MSLHWHAGVWFTHESRPTHFVNTPHEMVRADVPRGRVALVRDNESRTSGERMKNFDSLLTRLLPAALGTVISVSAFAQVPAPAAPPPAAAAPPAPAPVAPVPAAPAAPAQDVVPSLPPPAAAPRPPEPTPPAEPVDAPLPPPPPPPAPLGPEEKLPSIDVGAWLRVGLRFQNPNEPKKLNDQYFDTTYGELHLSGKVHKKVSYTLNFNADGSHKSANLLDAIIGLDFADEFHIWGGQLLVPVDRSNFSGPFFMIPWSYPGIYTVGSTTAFILPREGAYGRNVGSSVWGDIEKGTFKYYAGIFNLDSSAAAQSPLFSGRLALAALGKEPGYYGSSTYYGEQDIVAIGVGGQYQKHGSTLSDATGTVTNRDDYAQVNADLLAEFRLGDSGVITGEAAFYHFGGDYEPADNTFFVLASFLTPEVGVGKLQPMVRYQWARENTTKTKVSQIDAFVSYVIKGYTLRATAGFQHTDLDNGVEGNAIQIGLQTIQF